MSTEIKFKVYQKYAEEENFKHIGFERLNKDGNWEFIRNGRDNYNLGTISDNQGNAIFSRLRFTGNRDKSGKEIYENDIVRILYTDWPSKSESDERTLEQYLIDIANIGQVKFNDNSWEIEFYSEKYKDYTFSPISHGRYGYIEVIGNTYETNQ